MAVLSRILIDVEAGTGMLEHGEPHAAIRESSDDTLEKGRLAAPAGADKPEEWRGMRHAAFLRCPALLGKVAGHASSRQFTTYIS